MFDACPRELSDTPYESCGGERGVLLVDRCRVAVLQGGGSWCQVQFFVKEALQYKNDRRNVLEALSSRIVTVRKRFH